MLALPNRHALLQLLDDIARRLERALTMRMRNRYGDTALAHGQRAETMLRRDVVAVGEDSRLFDNRSKLTLRHRPVRCVLDSRHFAAVVHPAHDSKKEHCCSVRAP